MENSKKSISAVFDSENITAEVEQKGIVVVDDMKRMPEYGEPYHSAEMVLLLCHEGSARGEYDMQPIAIHANDFVVIYPDHSLLATETSPDFRATLIIISGSFYKELSRQFIYDNSVIFHHQPIFHLASGQYQCISSALQFLSSVSKVGLKQRGNVIASIINTISLLDEEFRQASPAGNTPIPTEHYESSARSYFHRFYEHLVLHYTESREVRFYAQKLCLSPKYFGSIIKKETGLSAGDWIARYVVIRAKTLLRYRPDLTIQQISHQLGFPDAASFSRYFKAGAGLTAKDYRDRKSE